ncbi:MAG TPA: hypothetical protein VGC42_08015, partial [Kofleriaceae bacterium]
MFRAVFVALVLLAGCHHDSDPPPMQPKEGELPPLPPSTGTPIGYLVDSAGSLALRDDQLSKLQSIDKSLGIRDEEIDTQLRLIEKPEDDPPPQKGAPMHLHNNAPGAQVKTNGDAAKLHRMRAESDNDALTRAFAVLDPDQQVKARKILEDRGVAPPGSKPKPA